MFGRRIGTIVRVLYALGLLAAWSVLAVPPVSIEDLLSFREIVEIRLSPAGDRVAHVTRVADADRSRNRDALTVTAIEDGRSRVLFEGAAISHLTWSPDGSSIFAVAGLVEERVLLRVDTTTGHVQEVFRFPWRVDQIVIAPEGEFLVAARLVYSDPGLAAARKASGLVFEYRHHDYRTILDGTLDEVTGVEIVRVDLETGGVRSLATLPFSGFRYLTAVRSLVLSTDGSLVAVQSLRRGEPAVGEATYSHRVTVIDVNNGGVVGTIPDGAESLRGMAWLGDSAHLFVCGGESGWIFHVRTQQLEPLPWLRLKGGLIMAAHFDQRTNTLLLQTRRALTRVGLDDYVVTELPITAAEATFDRDFSCYAFVSEDSNLRPEIAVADFLSGAARRLTNLNPWIDQRILGRVEKIEITNAFGSVTSAYLIHPVDAVPGRQYPLVLASYGFSGRFILTAEWHTSFPAQVLAGRGYAVLLVNNPPPGTRLAGNPRRAREMQGWEVLSTFEPAVQNLVSRGLADPQRLALYGWSHGSFVVEFLLAHSKLPFKAACIGEGGGFNPSGYWMWGGRIRWPDIYKNLFGGPLTREHASAYLEFCPVLNVDQINTPLLMEFVLQGGPIGLEFYTPLRERRVPAELVFYDREEHVFTRPDSRFASMNRKVDWIEFWMSSKEDPEPAKAEQYLRWRRLREEWRLKATTAAAAFQPRMIDSVP